ncbi:MAG: hypothetical protein HY897_00195 [Deltaproteobacteria bacterium]|nr:hypothetical protein [Deltaproteobacteria bacterium]
MKRIVAVLAVAFVFAFAACGPCSQRTAFKEVCPTVEMTEAASRIVELVETKCRGPEVQVYVRANVDIQHQFFTTTFFDSEGVQLGTNGMSFRNLRKGDIARGHDIGPIGRVRVRISPEY